MIGITRGISTLAGAAVAGVLLWFATQVGTQTTAEYWSTYGLIAAAGLTMALSQILGGWTKWGWPRFSLGVFLIGFLPVLVAGGWVLLARQPAGLDEHLELVARPQHLRRRQRRRQHPAGDRVRDRAHVRASRSTPPARVARSSRKSASARSAVSDADAPLTADRGAYPTPVTTADTTRDADADGYPDRTAVTTTSREQEDDRG